MLKSSCICIAHIIDLIVPGCLRRRIFVVYGYNWLVAVIIENSRFADLLHFITSHVVRQTSRNLEPFVIILRFARLLANPAVHRLVVNRVVIGTAAFLGCRVFGLDFKPRSTL